MNAICGAPTAPKVSKRCVHVYMCLWAIFSDEPLKKELSMCLFDAPSAPLAGIRFTILFCSYIDYGLLGNEVGNSESCGSTKHNSQCGYESGEGIDSWVMHTKLYHYCYVAS